MWPFLFILAIVPLAYFWSDSVLELFPQLAPYLPAKTAKPLATRPGTHPGAASAPTAEGVNQWVEVNTERGYVAWTLSPDGFYRLAVGCRPKERASLQVTRLDSKPLGDSLSVNYRFGSLALSSGMYDGSDIVGAVAQFNDVYVQAPTGKVTSFTLDTVRSGLVGRALQANCVSS